MGDTTDQTTADDSENSVAIVKAISALLPPHVIDKLVENAAHNNDNMTSVIKRRQYASYGIIFAIIVLVSVLAYVGAVHGSAAASILGAVAGHIFANANRAG